MVIIKWFFLLYNVIPITIESKYRKTKKRIQYVQILLVANQSAF